MASALNLASGLSSRVFSSSAASCSSSLERHDPANSRAGNRSLRSTFVGRVSSFKSLPLKDNRRQSHAVGRGVVASYGGGRREGDQTSKQVLDAFFLGRALAETINERLGSALGEFISEVSRVQAEQREFIREFQEEVQGRAEAELSKAAKSVLGEPSTSSARSYQQSSVTVLTPPVTTGPPATGPIETNPTLGGSTQEPLDPSED